jgi:hypothetical protein
MNVTFRLIGVKKDGNETIVMTGMTADDAKCIQNDPEITRQFETTRVEQDEGQSRSSWLTPQ